jgi:hypothetical protein
VGVWEKSESKNYIPFGTMTSVIFDISQLFTYSAVARGLLFTVSCFACANPTPKEGLGFASD